MSAATDHILNIIYYYYSATDNRRTCWH